MQSNKIKHGGILVAVSLLVADPAFALDFGNVMNPSKWFGGNRDRYDDDYYYDEGWGPGYPPPYGGGYGGPYGGPGFGYPGYGAPGVGAPGYGAPGVGAPGYGAPGVGAPGYPGVGPGVPGYTAPAYAAPESGSGSDSLEVERLKRRIRELEEQQRLSTEGASAPYGYQQPMPTPAPYGGAEQGSQAPGSSGGGGYGAGQQPAYGAPPAGQGTQWHYREDPSLPPMGSQ